jgi:hypothetical protein
MLAPPSLPAPVRERAFRAKNGELGILPSDEAAFLKACAADGVSVLGWELWIVDHRWDFDVRTPVAAKGSWCGGIPVDGRMTVYSGEGALPTMDEMPREWRDHVRANFTIAGATD